ncbi:MAG: PLDc N-terminal domain-containing protein [Pyrinomonadaceae bacterium]
MSLLQFGSVFAQRRANEPNVGDAAGGCAICGAGVGAMILVPILLVALNIALLVWVARDAKARGMDNSVLWMALVLFTSVLGLVIYIFSRPQGELIQCLHCGNKRLGTSAKCPTCGNA